MGQSVSWLSGLLWAKKEIRILILGLVSADELELGQGLIGSLIAVIIDLRWQTDRYITG